MMSTKTPSTSVGIMMPPMFSVPTYDGINKHLSKYMKSHELQWRSFASAWNGIAYRARAATEYDEEFTRLIAISSSPSPEERFQQENALFGFCVCALSTLECFFYATYCFASILKPTVFPISTPKDLKFYPKDVVFKFANEFVGEAIVNEMQTCLNSPTYTELTEIRNVLTHRGAPPRKYFMGGGEDGTVMMPSNPADLSVLWQYDFAVDHNTTQNRARWIDSSLSSLLTTTEQFCMSKL